jgi:hypothetical protein
MIPPKIKLERGNVVVGEEILREIMLLKMMNSVLG